MTRVKLALVPIAFALMVIFGWAQPSSAGVSIARGVTGIAAIATDEMVSNVHYRKKRMHRHTRRHMRRSKTYRHRNRTRRTRRHARHRKVQHTRHDTRLLFGMLGLIF